MVSGACFTGLVLYILFALGYYALIKAILSLDVRVKQLSYGMPLSACEVHCTFAWQGATPAGGVCWAHLRQHDRNICTGRIGVPCIIRKGRAIYMAAAAIYPWPPATTGIRPVVSRSSGLPRGAAARRRLMRLHHICPRMRMLDESVIARVRAPALKLLRILQLIFRTRALAPINLNARAAVLWNQHHTRRIPEGRSRAESL